MWGLSSRTGKRLSIACQFRSYRILGTETAWQNPKTRRQTRCLVQRIRKKTCLIRTTRWGNSIKRSRQAVTLSLSRGTRLWRVLTARWRRPKIRSRYFKSPSRRSSTPHPRTASQVMWVSSRISLRKTMKKTDIRGNGTRKWRRVSNLRLTSELPSITKLTKFEMSMCEFKIRD